MIMKKSNADTNEFMEELIGGPMTFGMAVEALRQMEDRERPLNLLPVLDGDRLTGIIRLHELLRVA